MSPSRWVWLTIVAAVAAACSSVSPSTEPIASASASVATHSAASSDLPTASQPPLLSPRGAESQPPVATVLTPLVVESRLKSVEPSLSLAAWSDDRDMGEYPKLVFRATTGLGAIDAPHINAVLVYPTTSERQAVQDDFGSSGIQGPRGQIDWDGVVHSEWIGFQNVIVEVVMPGGSFGGRTPTPSESRYPGQVRQALRG